MYSAQPPSYAMLLKRAEDCAERRTKHYVEDAIVFARWILTDGVVLQSNLTDTQNHCSTLLEENRALKIKLAGCVLERDALLQDAERMAGVRK
jgi:hypothetical protein